MRFVSDVIDDFARRYRACVNACACGDQESGTGTLIEKAFQDEGAGAIRISAFSFDLDVNQFTVLELDDTCRVFADEIVVVGAHEHGGAAHVDLLEKLHDLS